MSRQRDVAERLLERAGTTYAARAGIKLADKPAPLYRLLVLSVLMSTRIKADLAVAAGRELGEFPTPRKLRDASWQQRVDALVRGHYRRYDESTSTALGEDAQLLLDRYRDDLRRMRAEADGDVAALREALTSFKRLGPVGADFFCREVQEVWPEVRPYFDRKALQGAEQLGLDADPNALARLVDDADLARLAAGLVQVTLDRQLAREFEAAPVS